jgi:putative copper resistance protein D
MLTVARLLQFGAAAVLFGTPAFYIHGFPEASGRRCAWPRLILLTAAALSLASGVAWIMIQTAVMTGAARDALDPSAIASVLTQSHFGRVWAIRLGLMFVILVTLVLAPAARPRMLWTGTAVLGAALLASLALTGHGAADDGVAGAIHLLADGLHLLAAGAWLGALAALIVMLIRAARTATLAEAATARASLERFSGVGSTVVATLLLTGLVNSWFLVGPTHADALLASLYGQLLLLKIGLFVGMLALAAANRFQLTPRLARAFRPDSIADALAALRVSLIAETTLGVLVLVAVSWLGMLEPPVAGD